MISSFSFSSLSRLLAKKVPFDPSTRLPGLNGYSTVPYGDVLSGFRKILVCELNSGQFADWLRARYPGHDYIQCNKVQGQPFLVQEIVDAIEKAL